MRALIQKQPALGIRILENIIGLVDNRLRNAYEQLTSRLSAGLISQG